MPWLSVRPGGRLDIISYDYHRDTALMDVFYGQVADGATTMSRTYLAYGINGNIQPPGSTPFMATTSGSTRSRIGSLSLGRGTALHHRTSSRASSRVARHVPGGGGRPPLGAPLHSCAWELKPALVAEERQHPAERGDHAHDDHPEGRVRAVPGKEHVHSKDARDEG
jgi:hypothetical protein